MLVLTRKPGEKILIGDDIVITVLDARGDSVRIGIDAPRGVKIQRDEVLRAVTEANLAATLADADAEARIKASLGLALGGLQLGVPAAAPEAPAPTTSPRPHPPTPAD
ncbi:carbon storage regulator [Cryobacterium melibiosiphilum]|uniref:Translational regulator CsrA n=1 Tax=Cryobacterium melibiosiphilum TaxID=995039 RepID=A0A3A5MP60_9MICO|nr:carbon storage regulator CsrA [Cryobacterium melibiosiphilum]RJT88733.1 carbon storage regulator [Cryobacterium melibiosiphilum]